MKRLKKIAITTAFIPLMGLIILMGSHFLFGVSEWGMLLYLYIITLFLAYANIIFNSILLFVKNIRFAALQYAIVNLLVVLFYWLDPLDLLLNIA